MNFNVHLPRRSFWSYFGKTRRRRTAERMLHVYDTSTCLPCELSGQTLQNLLPFTQKWTLRIISLNRENKLVHVTLASLIRAFATSFGHEFLRCGHFLCAEWCHAVPVPHMQTSALTIPWASVEYMCVSGTYQAMKAIPKMALMQLKTRATIPRAVKPEGRGAGLVFSPSRFKTSSVLPAALPA